MSASSSLGVLAVVLYFSVLREFGHLTFSVFALYSLILNFGGNLYRTFPGQCFVFSIGVGSVIVYVCIYSYANSA